MKPIGSGESFLHEKAILKVGQKFLSELLKSKLSDAIDTGFNV
jgi:hypothetical protein